MDLNQSLCFNLNKKYSAFLESGPREFWKTPLNWMPHADLTTFRWDRIMGRRWK